MYVYDHVYVYKFQSTHPRGVRLHCPVRRNPQVVFQSTHPRGVRPNDEEVDLGKKAFQSTHPRGVRLLLAGGDDDKK